MWSSPPILFQYTNVTFFNPKCYWTCYWCNKNRLTIPKILIFVNMSLLNHVFIFSVILEISRNFFFDALILSSDWLKWASFEKNSSAVSVDKYKEWCPTKQIPDFEGPKFLCRYCTVTVYCPAPLVVVGSKKMWVHHRKSKKTEIAVKSYLL